MGSLCLVFFGLTTVILAFMTITKLKSKRPWIVIESIIMRLLL
jgi:hypothetical protein